MVPLGKKGPHGGQNHSYMGYDELIVYDTSQINMKYLVKLEFQCKEKEKKKKLPFYFYTTVMANDGVVPFG